MCYMCVTVHQWTQASLSFIQATLICIFSYASSSVVTDIDDTELYLYPFV